MSLRHASFAALVAALVALGGCAAVPDWRADVPPPDEAQRRCLALIAGMDDAVAAAGVADAEAVRIPSFPYLRTDRFLASFRHDTSSPEAFADWARRLRALDAEARIVEGANLPAAVQAQLSARHAVDDPAFSANRCGELLLELELLRDGGTARDALRRAVLPPSHYNQWVRALGLYPVTNIGAAIGYARWKAGNIGSFDRPVETLAPAAPRTVYAPPDMMLNPAAVARILRAAPRGPLGIPDIAASDIARLASNFAPVFEIETAGNDDRLGTPYWQAGEDGLLPAVDTARPVATARLAYTRFEGRVLPQFVYTVWFPSRPLQGSFDLLGGRLDGFIWRVTLDEDGTPLIYDAIHACGCYHMYFPVPPLARVAVPEDRDLREAPLAPVSAPRLARSERMVLRLASVSHYLLGIRATTRPVKSATPYALKSVAAAPEYGERSLPLPGGGRKSLHGPSGIVAGTERLERFTLWPLGIESPGAMRQWGTHATAFVGERHFDDPFLFDKGFAR